MFFFLISPCLTIISTRLFNIDDTKERDAIFLTVFRKNPAIPLSVVALSFKDTLPSNEYYIVFGMEFISGTIMDLIGHPLVMILRKMRVGYYCCKGQNAARSLEIQGGAFNPTKWYENQVLCWELLFLSIFLLFFCLQCINMCQFFRENSKQNNFRTV